MAIAPMPTDWNALQTIAALASVVVAAVSAGLSYQTVKLSTDERHATRAEERRKSVANLTAVAGIGMELVKRDGLLLSEASIYAARRAAERLLEYYPHEMPTNRAGHALSRLHLAVDEFIGHLDAGDDDPSTADILAAVTEMTEELFKLTKQNPAAHDIG